MIVYILGHIQLPRGANDAKLLQEKDDNIKDLTKKLDKVVSIIKIIINYKLVVYHLS